jgi:hypothetical protein
MYWPLLGGFIAFVLLAVIIGYFVDPSRAQPSERDKH